MEVVLNSVTGQGSVVSVNSSRCATDTRTETLDTIRVQLAIYHVLLNSLRVRSIHASRAYVIVNSHQTISLDLDQRSVPFTHHPLNLKCSRPVSLHLAYLCVHRFPLQVVGVR